jgi:hypothetical protein
MEAVTVARKVFAIRTIAGEQLSPAMPKLLALSITTGRKATDPVPGSRCG